MGKLNIAHHKSYHPYRADNIERVRRDEEEARLKEAQEDGRVMLADSEARIALLRERAKADAKPSKHKQQREEERLLQAGNPLIASPSSSTLVTKEKDNAGGLTLTALSGHVNFFEELEYSHQGTLEHNPQTKAQAEKARQKELERGVPLMPTAKDRNPWYMDKGLKHPKDMTDEEAKLKESAEPETEKEKWGKRARGNKVSSKTTLDPLADMQSQLAARSRALSSRTSTMPPPPVPRNSDSAPPKDAASERAAREAAERARAEALIARRRAALESSSVGGDTPISVRDGGYSDGYNKQETRAAHEAWERRRGRYDDRKWDEGVEDERDRRDRFDSSGDRHGGTSRDSRRHDHRHERDREREERRDRDRGEDRSRERERGRRRDLPRGERNRTRGVEDVRHLS